MKKKLLIEDLWFEVETTDQIFKDNTCNSCKDKDKLKGELWHFKTMYDDLFEEN